MFYSHEILTQRKHGIATVWLIATLGSRSTSRRISKKAILEVDIEKACEVVTRPQVPMALRLESNLLIGISRVYLSQCGYVLADAESIQHAMRTFIRSMRDINLDPNASRVRPETLLLTDDPNFMPDVIPELDMDFSKWELPTPSTSQHSSQRGRSERPSPISTGSLDGGFNIIIPSDEEPSVGEHPVIDQRQQEHEHPSLGPDEDLGFLPDVGFDFDADGNLVDTSFRGPRSEGYGNVASELGFDLPSLQNQLAGNDAPEIIPDDDNLPVFDNDEPLQAPTASVQVPHDQEVSLQQLDEEPDQGMAAIAPVRRERKARPLKIDDRQDVRSSVLQSWQTDYPTNMRNAKKQANAKRLATRARKFAAACVYGNGLGGLGLESSIMQHNGPLSMFAGQSLKDMVFGKDEDAEVPTNKRKRSDEPPSDDDGRNVRRKSDEFEAYDIETARGITNDDSIAVMEDDIEIGRNAGEPLEDFSQIMPWNVPSSQAGGSQAGGSQGGSHAGSNRPHSRAGSIIIPSVPFSAGGPPSSATTDLQELRRRNAPDASPLQGRGRSRDSDGPDSAENSFYLDDDNALEDFELYGADSFVSSQTGNDPKPAQGAPRKEEQRFLEFTKKALIAWGTSELTFEELVPTRPRTHYIAAQGFYHALSLRSKGILDVSQEEGFDAPIHISLAASA